MEKGIRICKVLALEYAVTAVLLLVLAFLLLKLKLSYAVINAGVVVIYLASNFVGGFLIGKITGRQKFLWGFLVGLIYAVIVSLLSFLIHKGFYLDVQHAVRMIGLSVAGGMLGGMLS